MCFYSKSLHLIFSKYLSHVYQPHNHIRPSERHNRQYGSGHLVESSTEPQDPHPHYHNMAAIRPVKYHEFDQQRSEQHNHGFKQEETEQRDIKEVKQRIVPVSQDHTFLHSNPMKPHDADLNRFIWIYIIINLTRLLGMNRPHVLNILSHSLGLFFWFLRKKLFLFLVKKITTSAHPVTLATVQEIIRLHCVTKMAATSTEAPLSAMEDSRQLQNPTRTSMVRKGNLKRRKRRKEIRRKREGRVKGMTIQGKTSRMKTITQKLDLWRQVWMKIKGKTMTTTKR